MNGLPYYKAYPRDFIEGTIGMDFETKAAYRLILDLIYMQGGSLPDDPRYISGLLGCSVKKWSSLRKTLISAGKIEVRGDYLGNLRADKELETLGKFQDKQRENRSRPNKNNDLKKPPFDHTEPDTDKKEDTNVSSKKTAENPPDEVGLDFDRFWSEYPHRGGQKKNRKGAEAKFRLVVKRGVSVDDILAGVSAMRRFPEVQRGFARDPVVWLNQSGWEDEPPPPGFESIDGGRRDPRPGDKRISRDGLEQEYGGYGVGWLTCQN